MTHATRHLAAAGYDSGPWRPPRYRLNAMLLDPRLAHLTCAIDLDPPGPVGVVESSAAVPFPHAWVTAAWPGRRS